MPGLFDRYKYGKMRANMANDDPMHNVIGPLEHREFARDVVRDNPLAAPGMLAATPVYTGAKALARAPMMYGLPPLALLQGLLRSKGYSRTRSEPSVDEIWGGLVGTGEGLMDALRDRKS